MWQIRHRDLGVFQGSANGIVYWYKDKSSLKPEFGFFMFNSVEAAEELVNEFVVFGFDFTDFVIEPFDRRMSNDIKQSGYACLLAEMCIPFGLA